MSFSCTHVWALAACLLPWLNSAVHKLTGALLLAAASFPLSVLSSGGRRTYCSLVQRVEPRWWPKAWQWETLVLLDLSPGPGNTRLISGQQDFISFGSLLSPLPLIGWAYSSLLRRAAGLSISAAVQLSGCTYRSCLSAYKAAVFAAGGTDAGPPPSKPARKAGRRVVVQALAR